MLTSSTCPIEEFRGEYPPNMLIKIYESELTHLGQYIVVYIPKPKNLIKLFMGTK